MPIAPSVLDGDLLHAFDAFARTLNFTHAAKEIHLSQPALHERVRKLGDLVGVSLYARRGRSIALTETGRALAAFARDTLARAESFARDVRGEPRRDVVTLAAGEGALLYLLGPALSAFRAKRVATLRLRTTGARATADAVLSGQADLGVSVFDVVPRGLVAQDLHAAAHVAALPARHVLARRSTLRLEDLAYERWILPPEGRLYRDLIARSVAKSGAEVEAPIEADGWPLMLALVAAGLGVSIVNGCCKPPRGVVLRPVPELGTVRYRVVTRRGVELSSPASTLFDLVRRTK